MNDEHNPKKPYFLIKFAQIGKYVERHPSIPAALFTLASLWPVAAGAADYLSGSPGWETKLGAGALNTASFVYMTARAKKDGYSTGTLINTVGYSLLMWPGFNGGTASAVMTGLSLACLYGFNTPIITENHLVKPAQKMVEKFRAGTTFFTKKIAKNLLWPFAYPRKYVSVGGLITQPLLAAATYLTLGQQNLTAGFVIALTGCVLLACTKPKADVAASTTATQATQPTP